MHRQSNDKLICSCKGKKNSNVEKHGCQNIVWKNRIT